MRSKLLNVDPPVTYALGFDVGDQVAALLGLFIRENEIEAGSITAIGGFRHALLGYFDWNSKEYRKIVVDEQVEVLSLIGESRSPMTVRAGTFMPFLAGPMAG